MLVFAQLRPSLRTLPNEALSQAVWLLSTQTVADLIALQAVRAEKQIVLGSEHQGRLLVQGGKPAHGLVWLVRVLLVLKVKWLWDLPLVDQ